MTISAKYEPIEYIGDGKTTNFVPPFRFFDREIEVTINGSPTDRFDTLGGTVIFHTAPAKDSVVVFKRRVPLEQQIKFIEGENFPAADFEYSLDRLYMALQELKQRIYELENPESGEEEPNVDDKIEALTTAIHIINGKIAQIEQENKAIEEDIKVINATLEEHGKRIIQRHTLDADVSPEDWKNESYYEEYPYSAVINCLPTDTDDVENPLWAAVPTVIFNPEQADSGNFATVADTGFTRIYDESNIFYPFAFYVRIYAKEIPTETFNVFIKLD